MTEPIETIPSQNNPATKFLVAGVIIVAALAAVLLVLLNPKEPEPITPPASGLSARLNNPAPDFELPNLDDEIVRLSDYRGQMVFLNFWATWCVPCQREMPAFQVFMEERNDTDPIILAVDDGEHVSAVPPFVEEFGITDVPILLDPNSEVSRSFAVGSLPTTFVIDAEGVVRAIKLGEITLDDMSAYIAQFSTS